MHKLRKILACACAMVCTISAMGQNATSSPSSRFALGEMNDNIPGEYRAMGGVSTGMRRNTAINPSQPASYTAFDTLTFMFDIAGSVMWTNYSDASGKRNKANGNLEYIMLGFPLWKQHIAFSAGVLPYSTMGYGFMLASDGFSHPYNVNYSGEGTITQAYGGLSFNICDWVALGANFYYMFGNLQNLTALTFSDASLQSSMMYRRMDISSWRGRYGMQFFHTFGDHKIVLGGVFESKLPLKGEYLQYELNTIDSVLVKSDGFELPMTWSAGFSYTYANRATIALDYTRQNWSDALYFGSLNTLSDRGRWSMGFEYRHNPMSRKYVDQVRWRVGATVLDSYVQTSGKKDFALSVGFGLPLHNVSTMINATIEYNHRSSAINMSENVLKLTINAAINETWFFKRRL